MSFIDEPMLEDILLHQMKVGATTRIGASFLESMRMEVVRDELDDITVRMTGRVLSEMLPPEWVHESRIVRVPLSWWDHWKQAHERSWWAGWFARWRGHRTREIELEVRIDLKRFWAYPQANIALPPKLGVPVRMHVMHSAVTVLSDREEL